MNISLPKSCRQPKYHTIIERNDRKFNVIAETDTEYIVADAFAYADGVSRVHLLVWDKQTCRVVEGAK